MVAPRARSSRGFALVDVLVGAILIGISLAVIIGLTGQSITAQRRGEELATAANLADEQLQLLLARGPDEYAKRFRLEGPCDPPFQDYSYKLVISGGSTNRPYNISCEINWMSGRSPQSVIIETLMASRDGGDGEPDPLRTPDQPVLRQP